MCWWEILCEIVARHRERETKYIRRLWWNAYQLTSNETMRWSVNPTTWNPFWHPHEYIGEKCLIWCVFFSFPSMTNTSINVNYRERTCVKHECAHINIEHCMFVILKWNSFYKIQLNFSSLHVHVHNTSEHANKLSKKKQQQPKTPCKKKNATRWKKGLFNSWVADVERNCNANIWPADTHIDAETHDIICNALHYTART